MNDATDRRRLLAGASSLLVSAALPGAARSVPKPAVKGEEDVSPAEDLMREHGALNRLLLIYEEAAARLETRREFPPEVLAGAASIIRRFIEGYHEKLEEEHLFPRFEKAGKLVDLVSVLRRQHVAGRGLTARIEAASTASGLRDPGERGRLARSLRLFIRMYRPHEAREDTVLFPALRGLVGMGASAGLIPSRTKRERLRPTPWWWLSAPPWASTTWVAASHAARVRRCSACSRSKRSRKCTFSSSSCFKILSATSRSNNGS